MGRGLLISAACLALAGCKPAQPATQAAAEPHATLACAACHQGRAIGTQVASVPASACTSSGCHTNGGPPQARLGDVTFQHANHAANGAIAASCAGCHTHAPGTNRLTTSADACALCHVSQIATKNAQDCRVCHAQEKHVALTSQGVPVPHSSLPWLETGCVRCHYDVSAPPTAVPASRCRSCHGSSSAVDAAAIGKDVHPQHEQISCTSCHSPGLHRVQAMSSAVVLRCADCHMQAHGLTLAGDSVEGPSYCESCHGTVHQAQQELLLGLVPGLPPSPSRKFVAGMTCRSCHIAPASGQPLTSDVAIKGAIKGQAASCAGCHRQEYATVLSWWLEGTRARTAEARRYTAQAARDLGGVTRDTVRTLLDGAQAMLAVVEKAGGQHNLELSDRILRTSVARAAEAYRLAGRTAPRTPGFGPAPHEGLCSYCHYDTNEQWDYNRMPADFHRAVVGREGS